MEVSATLMKPQWELVITIDGNTTYYYGEPGNWHELMGDSLEPAYSNEKFLDEAFEAWQLKLTTIVQKKMLGR